MLHGPDQVNRNVRSLFDAAAAVGSQERGAVSGTPEAAHGASDPAPSHSAVALDSAGTVEDMFAAHRLRIDTAAAAA
jgi:hypothetical protein